jgi:hypothetical protein
MRNSIILFLLLAISVTSCRKDFDFEPSTGGLVFSRDTVYLDTVFTNIGSSTYTLKVYNKSNRDISIPSVKLGKGLDSKYRITVDGMVGNQNKIFTNVELLAKDSLYIFIETTADVADANPSDFLYTDKIEFYNINSAVPQTVELVTLIQDAYFLYPQRFEDGTTETLPIGDQEVYGFFLDENDPVNGNELEWNNSKPYVIYGYAAVPSNKTLNVQAGARIHFHDQSGLIAANNASIKVNGLPPTNLENPDEFLVIFEGDRLEPLYTDVAGQWGQIWLTNGSKNHEFKNCIIKNADLGLLIEGNTGLGNAEADVQLNNVQIYNMKFACIYGVTAHVKGENVVLNNAGLYSLACIYGGKYNFNHSTFNNNWPSTRQVSVFLNNYIESAIPPIQPMVEATFTNSIIHGTNQIEMIIDKVDGEVFNYKFDHCLIRFNNINNIFTNDPLYQFATDTTRFVNCLIATNPSLFPPDFQNPNNNQFVIGQNSAAIGQGNFTYSNGTSDLLNKDRTTPSDLGAYNFVEFEED